MKKWVFVWGYTASDRKLESKRQIKVGIMAILFEWCSVYGFESVN